MSASTPRSHGLRRLWVEAAFLVGLLVFAVGRERAIHGVEANLLALASIVAASLLRRAFVGLEILPPAPFPAFVVELVSFAGLFAYPLASWSAPLAACALLAPSIVTAPPDAPEGSKISRAALGIFLVFDLAAWLTSPRPVGLEALTFLVLAFELTKGSWTTRRAVRVAAVLVLVLAGRLGAGDAVTRSVLALQSLALALFESQVGQIAWRLGAWFEREAPSLPQACRSWAGLLASPEPRAAPTDRWDAVAVAGALGVTAWLLAFKLLAFWHLAYTAELFGFVEFARSPFDEAWFTNHCEGGAFSTHTYFLIVVFAPLVKLMGAPGLLLVLAVGAGATVWLSHRILRTLDVPGAVSSRFALLLVASPLALHHFHDETSGFHVELLVLPLALWLLQELLLRRVKCALVATLVLLSVKEEAPLVVGVVAGVVQLEAIARARVDRTKRFPIEPLALLVGAMAVVALPLMLAFIKSRPPEPFSAGNFGRLRFAAGSGVEGSASLTRFVLAHPGAWLASRAARTWFAATTLASLGTLALRPHLAPLGFLLSVVAWLMDDDLMWAPRFAGSFTFAWIVALFAAASLHSVLGGTSPGGRRRWLAAVTGLVFALSLWWQIGLTGHRELEPVSLEPYSWYSPEERAGADELFRVYRDHADPREPTIASTYLFRYVHDRNLYWFDRLGHGRPDPVWVLWDEKLLDLWSFVPRDRYEVVARSGRFTVYRLRR